MFLLIIILNWDFEGKVVSVRTETNSSQYFERGRKYSETPEIPAPGSLTQTFPVGRKASNTSSSLIQGVQYSTTSSRGRDVNIFLYQNS